MIDIFNSQFWPIVGAYKVKSKDAKDRRGIHLVMKWFYRGIEAPMGLVLVGALLALCLSSYPIIFFGNFIMI